jgi:hypothetical protein
VPSKRKTLGELEMTDFVLPIIVDEEGNLVVHETAEHACYGMEAIDVFDGVYDVFDAEGRRLVLVVQGDQISLRESPDHGAEPDELRRRLHNFIERIGTDWLKIADLDQTPTPVLIGALLRFQRGEFSIQRSPSISDPGGRSPLFIFLSSFLALQIGVVLLRWWRSSDDSSNGDFFQTPLAVLSLTLALGFVALLALSVPNSLRDAALKKRFPASIVLPANRVDELLKNFPAAKIFRSPGMSSEIPLAFGLAADRDFLDIYTGSSSPRLLARFPWGSVTNLSLGTGSQVGTTYPTITVTVATPEGTVQLPIVVTGSGLLGLGYRRLPVLAQILTELESLRTLSLSVTDGPTTRLSPEL